jgi:peroxiredoxin (alkyl hydroperoxide reductase subunit C)
MLLLKSPIKVSKKIFDFDETAVLSSKEFARITSDKFLEKWIVLFFYPLDFIFVCPTEIISFNEAYKNFTNIGIEVIEFSIDSIYLHLAWINTFRNNEGIESIKYRFILNLGEKIIKRLGFYLWE